MLRSDAEIETPHGPARVVQDVPAGAPASLLVLGHGAGGDVEAPDLVALRDAVVAAGVAVARVTQPYRVAGRRAPAPARQLDEAWVTVVTALLRQWSPAAGDPGPPARAPHRVSSLDPGPHPVPSLDPGLHSVPPPARGPRSAVPLVLGGRSSGARVACRTALGLGAAGVLALAFPLHPPGRPERTRAAELATGVPTLVLNGDRDPFGVPAGGPGVEVRVRPGERHDLRLDPAGTASLALRWLRGHGWARAAGCPAR